MKLTGQEIDRIFDAYQDAPTTSFRYLVTREIEKALEARGAKGALGYVITVTALVERTEIAGKDWTTVAHEPVEGTDRTRPVLGYTPETEKTVRREVQLFEQRVDTLDMQALVSVINGLPVPTKATAEGTS